jgi:hypothetical protein
MKAIRTRIELLQELGPHQVGAQISINPMIASKLIAQGKAKVCTDELTEEVLTDENPIVDPVEELVEEPIQDEPTEENPKYKPAKKK